MDKNIINFETPCNEKKGSDTNGYKTLKHVVHASKK